MLHPILIVLHPQELAKREQLRRQEQEDEVKAEEERWSDSSFWRVPPSLDDLDEEDREALLNSRPVHVPPLILPSDSDSDSSSDESESESDESSASESESDSGSSGAESDGIEESASEDNKAQ